MTVTTLALGPKTQTGSDANTKDNRKVKGTITLGWSLAPLLPEDTIQPPETEKIEAHRSGEPFPEVLFADDVEAERERLGPIIEKDQLPIDGLMGEIEARAHAASHSGRLGRDGDGTPILPEVHRGQLLSAFIRKAPMTLLQGTPLRLVMPFHDSDVGNGGDGADSGTVCADTPGTANPLRRSRRAGADIGSAHRDGAANEHALVICCTSLSDMDRAFIGSVSLQMQKAVAVIRANQKLKAERLRILAQVGETLRADEDLTTPEMLFERLFELIGPCLPGAVLFGGALEPTTDTIHCVSETFTSRGEHAPFHSPHTEGVVCVGASLGRGEGLLFDCIERGYVLAVHENAVKVAHFSWNEITYRDMLDAESAVEPGMLFSELPAETPEVPPETARLDSRTQASGDEPITDPSPPSPQLALPEGARSTPREIEASSSATALEHADSELKRDDELVAQTESALETTEDARTALPSSGFVFSPMMCRGTARAVLGVGVAASPSTLATRDGARGAQYDSQKEAQKIFEGVVEFVNQVACTTGPVLDRIQRRSCLARLRVSCDEARDFAQVYAAATNAIRGVMPQARSVQVIQIVRGQTTTATANDGGDASSVGTAETGATESGAADAGATTPVASTTTPPPTPLLGDLELFARSILQEESLGEVGLSSLRATEPADAPFPSSLLGHVWRVLRTADADICEPFAVRLAEKLVPTATSLTARDVDGPDDAPPVRTHCVLVVRIAPESDGVVLSDGDMEEESKFLARVGTSVRTAVMRIHEQKLAKARKALEDQTAEQTAKSRSSGMMGRISIRKSKTRTAVKEG
jgi:hypothetical protein